MVRPSAANSSILTRVDQTTPNSELRSGKQPVRRGMVRNPTEHRQKCKNRSVLTKLRRISESRRGSGRGSRSSPEVGDTAKGEASRLCKL